MAKEKNAGRASKGLDGMKAISAAMDFIGEVGGIEEAKGQIESIKALLANCGGSEGALAAIAQIERIKKLK